MWCAATVGSDQAPTWIVALTMPAMGPPKPPCADWTSGLWTVHVPLPVTVSGTITAGPLLNLGMAFPGIGIVTLSVWVGVEPPASWMLVVTSLGRVLGAMARVVVPGEHTIGQVTVIGPPVGKLTGASLTTAKTALFRPAAALNCRCVHPYKLGTEPACRQR
jgi:hypothetical protein